jgi:hypothetical protein
MVYFVELENGLHFVHRANIHWTVCGIPIASYAQVRLYAAYEVRCPACLKIMDGEDTKRTEAIRDDR